MSSGSSIFPFESIKEVRREASLCLFGHAENVIIGVDDGIPIFEADVVRLHSGETLRDGGVRFTGRWLHLIRYRGRSVATAETEISRGQVIVPCVDVRSPVHIDEAFEDVLDVNVRLLRLPALRMEAAWGVHWGPDRSAIRILSEQGETKRGAVRFKEEDFVVWIRDKTDALTTVSKGTN